MNTPFFDLTGKLAVVTGAASGIGAATAIRFSRAGAELAVVDLDAAGAEKIVAQIREAGGKAGAHVLDVTDPAACAALAETLRGVWGRDPDVVVNSAGIGHVGTLLETEITDLERLNRVNVGGAFNVSKAFLPGMITRGSGSLIQIASVCGVLAVPDRLAYNTTKYAVVGMTKSMALDHAASGVRVNAICPARVKTAFVEARIREYPDPAKALHDMSVSQPCGRMADPEEIAAAAHYLASDESAFMTGAAFCIDGGYSAGR